MSEEIAGMEELLLVVLGFLLGLLPGWWERRSRLKVHWGALRAEVVQNNKWNNKWGQTTVSRGHRLYRVTMAQ
jgi:hypothetical protein